MHSKEAINTWEARKSIWREDKNLFGFERYHLATSIGFTRYFYKCVWGRGVPIRISWHGIKIYMIYRWNKRKSTQYLATLQFLSVSVMWNCHNFWNLLKTPVCILDNFHFPFNLELSIHLYATDLELCVSKQCHVKWLHSCVSRWEKSYTKSKYDAPIAQETPDHHMANSCTYAYM